MDKLTLSKPRVLETKVHGDDRGFVYCALDRMHELGIKRTYVVENFARGQVRAWHGHHKSATLLHCISGAIKTFAFPILDNVDDAFCHAESATLSARIPNIFYVPEGHYNGFVSLEDNTKVLVYSTHTFDEVIKDDVRLPWDACGTDIWKVANR